MKHILLLVAVLAWTCTSTHAKIWRVNNNNGVAADFTTLQAAHNGAASGDTLHLEGSPTSYGSLTSVKKLVILGPGYFLDLNVGLQVLSLTAKTSYMIFNAGADGSVVMGLDFDNNSLNIYCDNVTIKRNKFSRISSNVLDQYTGAIHLNYKQNNISNPVTNILITQNYGFIININYPSNSIIVTNNYIGCDAASGDATTVSALNMHANAVVILQNNIFRRGKVTAHNSTITNNILYAGTFEGTGNLISNNIASGTQFGSQNGNKANVNMSTVFEAATNSDAYWKLKNGSPALAAGYGSTAQNPIDCGIFSGPAPYVLSGIPPIPAIYFFTNQPVGSNGDPIDVTIKVRSNN
ncbi:hypothetical protein BWI96_10500 [Siphonobacter sp. SORGH_AS_0500]|uniref:hypothetical protein n=1 Tax=Siphonobacter sp. SORGH_AS_0500 TaxID=1864824 RepID=UPI000CB4563E|nr:hypothetical protein [Siphonobacter sp. SORGH_AS_0500]PKK36792.1 hypothetical protein BWI96_10500 [Siphonobacter sp. SORGH_AS_0500]